MTSGIYLITNNINGHMYVGGSIDIENRFSEHKRGKNADNQAIDRAILKYGKENFTYQIITELPSDWKIIGEHEKYWIKFYNTFKDRQHYNLTEGGEGNSTLVGYWKDKTRPEETKKKISDALKGENHWNYGKKHSDETRKKMSENHADFSGENHPRWKDYARIVKGGFRGNKQQYTIRFNGKVIKTSISIDKLVKWFTENYPNEELIVDAEN